MKSGKFVSKVDTPEELLHALKEYSEEASSLTIPIQPIDSFTSTSGRQLRLNDPVTWVQSPSGRLLLINAGVTERLLNSDEFNSLNLKCRLLPWAG